MEILILHGAARIDGIFQRTYQTFCEKKDFDEKLFNFASTVCFLNVLNKFFIKLHIASYYYSNLRS